MSGRKWRALGLIALGLTIVVGVGLGWAAIRADGVRRHLVVARAQVDVLRAQLTAGQTDAAYLTLAALTQESRAAVAETQDPVWRTVSAVPFFGRSLRTTKGIAVVLDDLAAHALPDLVMVRERLTPTALRSAGGAVNLTLIQSVEAPLQSVTAATERAVSTVRALPSSVIVVPVARARDQVLVSLTDFARELNRAAGVARVAPALLGGNGPRLYFVGVENNAEARGTGGLVGAYGIIRADHGRISMMHFGSDLELMDAPAPVIRLDSPYELLWASYGATSTWASSNLSPHFPYSAQIWLALYEHAHPGVHLDGAIGVDPVALADVMGSIGPVALSNGALIPADKVVFVTENLTYYKIQDPVRRKSVLVDIARGAFHQVADGSGTAKSLVAALQLAADTHHLTFYSAHRDEESALTGAAVAGELSTGPASFAEVVVNNTAGSKLDYYLTRKLRYQADGCQGTERRSRIVIDIGNTAPARGLPAYITERADHPRGPYPVGQEKLLLSVYATAGARFTDVRLDGAAWSLTIDSELGHPVWSTDLLVNPGQTRELAIDLVEPVIRGSDPVQVPVQPLVNGQDTVVSVPRC